MPTHRELNQSRELLLPFARQHAELLRPLQSLPTPQLQRLVEACDHITETNCWWACFQVAPILKAEAGAILNQRSESKTAVEANRN